MFSFTSPFARLEGTCKVVVAEFEPVVAMAMAMTITLANVMTTVIKKNH